jgi:hypothetical protein
VTIELDAKEEESLQKLEKMYAAGSVPLWSGCRISIISAVVVIMTMCTIHGVTNSFIDELLKYLSTSGILPDDNLIPGKFYDCKIMVQKLGLSYEMIHACPVGCVLFRHEHMLACEPASLGA